MISPTPPQRNKIFVEDAAILKHDHCRGDQHVIRFSSPKISSYAQPGAFIHLSCGEAPLLRRPMSILSTDPISGSLEVLYKVVGQGSKLLSRQTVGTTLSVMGPIGHPFQYLNQCNQPLLIGGGVGVPPVIFLAESMRKIGLRPILLVGTEVPLPFEISISRNRVCGVDSTVDATISPLDKKGIPNRLASLQGYKGFYRGYVTELANQWIQAAKDEMTQVKIFACGPIAMLQTVSALAERHDIDCEISLEEYMACAVGGCAGCTVRVCINGIVTMKRVCVDGPVFNSREILFP